jgi:hypothetical protein
MTVQYIQDYLLIRHCVQVGFLLVVVMQLLKERVIIKLIVAKEHIQVRQLMEAALGTIHQIVVMYAVSQMRNVAVQHLHGLVQSVVKAQMHQQTVRIIQVLQMLQNVVTTTVQRQQLVVMPQVQAVGHLPMAAEVTSVQKVIQNHSERNAAY